MEDQWKTKRKNEKKNHLMIPTLAIESTIWPIIYKGINFLTEVARIEFNSKGIRN